MASRFFQVVHTPKVPTYKQAVDDLDLLLKAHRKALVYSALQRGHALGYERAVGIFKERINWTLGIFQNDTIQTSP